MQYDSTEEKMKGICGKTHNLGSTEEEHCIVWNCPDTKPKAFYMLLRVWYIQNKKT